LSSLVRTTAPVKKLFSVQDLYDLLRISESTTSDQNVLLAYLDAATEWIEDVAGISIMKQVWTLKGDQFPYNRDGFDRRYPLGKPMLLPNGPVISIDTFTYQDLNNQTQNINSSSFFQAALDERPPALYPPYGGFFPTALWVPGALTLVMTCGMSGAADDATKVDNDVKMAVKFLVAHWNENREPVPVNVGSKMPYALETMIASIKKGYGFDWRNYYSYSYLHQF
jgi:uncharacterized phiE125 gp8 family phage protein